MDLETIDDPRERAALESQISEFGQCPSLLFEGPHPRRDDTLAPIRLAPGLQRQVGDVRGLSPYSETRLSGSSTRDRGVVELSPSMLHGGDRNGGATPAEARYRQPVREASGHSHGTVTGGRDARDARAPNSDRRASPAPSVSPSGPFVGSGLSVGSSVGALWKRGLAMAGAVGGAAAEAAGARGLRPVQGWPRGGEGMGGGRVGDGGGGASLSSPGLVSSVRVVGVGRPFDAKRTGVGCWFCFVGWWLCRTMVCGSASRLHPVCGRFLVVEDPVFFFLFSFFVFPLALPTVSLCCCGSSCVIISVFYGPVCC